MFCSQCGTENQPEACFCQKCGNSLSGATAQPKSSAKSQDTGSAIWNPNATANWSLIFSSAFGSYLQMLNWRALGEPEKAASSKNWFYVSLGVLVVGVPAVYVLMGVSEAADGAARMLVFLFLVVWYFSVGKNQGKYVKEKFGSTYARKPWGKALLIGVAASFGYFIVTIIAMATIGLALSVTG